MENYDIIMINGGVCTFDNITIKLLSIILSTGDLIIKLKSGCLKQ